MALFLCSMFFILYQVTVTTTNPPLTVVYTNALTTVLTVTLVPISMGQTAALVQHDVVLPLILRTQFTITSAV